MERGAIEVAPLAFMRGRTLNDSFIILDEAQNTTAEQMKMFLTRLGFGSKAVVTGDVTQIDLPDGRSPVRAAAGAEHPGGHPRAVFVELSGRDVVRHRIVADIVDAYLARSVAPRRGDGSGGGLRRRRAGRGGGRCPALGPPGPDGAEEQGVRGDAELSMLFVDEKSMADLNERFLGRDGPTDVLAFPMDDELIESGRQPDQGGRGPGSPAEPSDAPILVGDVVICPQVAERQAQEHSVPLDDELTLLVVHGVLHLLGFDHEDDDEAAVMERRERELMARSGSSSEAQ